MRISGGKSSGRSLKVPKGFDVRPTPDLVKRFKAEAEAAASLSHPNIVPIHEVGEHMGQHYFSMGLIEGTNLRQELTSGRSRLDIPRNAAQLVATVARVDHHGAKPR